MPRPHVVASQPDDGLQEGIELALELKFGSDGLALVPLVRQVHAIEVLRTVRQALRTADTLEQIRNLLTPA